MKQKLIALATQKGFDSEVYDANDESYPLIGLHYYLWMCELQKWLNTEHGLYAYIDHYNSEVVMCDYKNKSGKDLIRFDTYDFIADYEDDEELLEKLLLKTLEYI